MTFVANIVVGGFTGWLTGIAARDEDDRELLKERHVGWRDVVCGILGAVLGEYLFFWLIIERSSSFSSYAATVLGAITLTGASRLIAARYRVYIHKRNSLRHSSAILKRSIEALDTAAVRDEESGHTKTTISYKDYLIAGESFQREENGAWIAQYVLRREQPVANQDDFPIVQYQFNESFPTQRDADDYALRRATEWIDKSVRGKMQNTN
jgi:uncharacterized membrane protein YeaQ/YmgE (transglycosylase-associated protein family)